MINIDTWFFYKSPLLEQELHCQNSVPDSIEFLETAKIITNKCFKEAIEQRRVLVNLSSSNKENYINSLMEEILSFLYQENPLPINLSITVDQKYVKNILRSLFFPELVKNLGADVTINLNDQIELLEKTNNDSNFKYVDTYSIFQLTGLVAFQKLWHHIMEQEVITSKSARKTFVRKLKKTKDLLEHPNTVYRNGDDFKVVLYAILIKGLTKSKNDEIIFESILNSKVQSLNAILRLMPERIITAKEIADRHSINFKKTKPKNYLLYNILQNLFPGIKYPSIEKFPIELDSEIDDYVKETVKERFY